MLIVQVPSYLMYLNILYLSHLQSSSSATGLMI